MRNASNEFKEARYEAYQSPFARICSPCYPRPDRQGGPAVNLPRFEYRRREIAALEQRLVELVGENGLRPLAAGRGYARASGPEHAGNRAHGDDSPGHALRAEGPADCEGVAPEAALPRARLRRAAACPERKEGACPERSEGTPGRTGMVRSWVSGRVLQAGQLDL